MLHRYRVVRPADIRGLDLQHLQPKMTSLPPRKTTSLSLSLSLFDVHSIRSVFCASVRGRAMWKTFKKKKG